MSRYDLGRDELAELCAGEPSYRVDQVLEGLYRRLAEPAQMTDLARGLRERLERAPEMASAYCITAVPSEVSM